MPIARGLSLRLFLEGEEIPVISASVSSNINAPATATIQIVPLDEAMDFKPRTMVHLFFLDDRPKGREDAASIDDDYKCLFVGEVVGFNYIQSPDNRGLVIQCLDHSSYWDCAHATAIEYGPEGNLMFNEGALLGSDDTIFDDIINQSQEKLVSWIKQKPLTEGLKNVEGLTGGIIRMLEALGGVAQHHKGVNDFFTISELRCRLLNQVASEETDDTAKRILENRVLEDWLSNNLQHLGQQVTFRDLLKLLLSHIYYDVVPNPTPKWEPSADGKTVRIKEQPLNVEQSVELQSAIASLQTASSDFSFVARETNKITGNAAKFFNDNSLKNLKFISDLLGKVPEAKNKLLQIIATLEVLTKVATIDSVRDYASIPGRIALVIDAIKQAQVPEFKVPAHNTIIGASQQRLKTQIIRPDCWFVSPPRCNVIFPEQYSQLSYDRSFIGEATRTLTQMANFITGTDRLFAVKIMAPNIGTEAKILTDTAGQESYRVLMKHEYHTGIVLKTEWMPDSAVVRKATNLEEASKVTGARVDWTKRAAMFHFFKYRFASRALNVAGRFNPYLVCGFPGAVILKPFKITETPRDNGVDLSDFVQKAAEATGCPTQLVGMIAGVHHTIDQSGGTTSVEMHHVRKHKGVDDEFLKVLLQNKTDTRKLHVAMPLNLDEILNNKDSKLFQLLVDLTPQKSPPPTSTTSKVTSKTKTSTQPVSKDGGQTTLIESINVVSRREEVIPATEPSPVQEAKIVFSDGATQIMNIPKIPGTKGAKSDGLVGKIVAVEVLDSTIVDVTDFIVGKAPKSRGKAFKSVLLHQEITTTNETKTPFENLLRPAWFAEVYSNSLIGKKVYTPLFGCEAVVDDLVISGIGDVDVPVIKVPPDTSAEYFTKYAADLATSKARNSLERALNVLAYTYYKIKSQRLDIDDFIRQYTTRPIATKEQLLGSSNLGFEISGNSVTPVSMDGDDISIGFHTMAVHPDIVEASKTTKLIGLMKDPDTGLQRIDNEGKSEAIIKSLDVRWEKKEQVMLYKLALNSHAFQG
jgi:hypothetical protein